MQNTLHRNFVKLFLIIGFTFCFSGTKASFVLSENCREAHACILRLEINDAAQWLAKEKSTNPDNLLILYFENYSDFVRLAAGSELIDSDELIENMEARLNTIEKQGEKDSPYYLYVQAELRFHLSVARYYFSDNLRMAYDLYKAHRLIQENHETFGDFVWNKKIRGLFYIIFGAVPEDYQWIVEIIGFHGDTEKGFRLLSEYYSASEDGSGQHVESVILLAMSKLYFSENKQSAIVFLDREQTLAQDVSSVRFVHALAEMHTGRSDEAIALLENYEQKSNETRLCFFDYMLGVNKLNRLDNDANEPFETFLHNYNGRHYIKAAYQKLAWHYYLQGNEVMYRSCVKNVQTRGYSILSSDVQAMREVERNRPPNVYLLKARLLSDGGYYEKALQMLLQNAAATNYPTDAEQLEYSYRIARIYHGSGHFDKAIVYYKSVIANGSEAPYFFAAYSALQMALIYESRNDVAEARRYFNLCLDLNHYGYKNSIEQKAKSGLQRIK